MAVFDESKVINALHTDKAEMGKKYYAEHTITALKMGEYIKEELPDVVCGVELDGNESALILEIDDEQQKRLDKLLSEFLKKVA